jgi:5-methylcytosine-specific restriction endonuclease McrA
VTNLEKIEADEDKLQRVIDNNYRCEVCSKRFGYSELQLAHIIPKHGNYIKRFTTAVIHHQDNMVLTCSKCNSGVMLSPDTIPGAKHIEKIENKLYNNK